MFKVVLVLKQISIRLKECQLDIVLRKNKQSVVLCSKVPLINGSSSINLVKEFYVDVDDCLITLVVYLFIANEKKYGGEINLHVFQWEENVIHATESKIINCPDKSSRFKYEFYYFRDDKVADNRIFFMSKEKHRQQYNLIQTSNKLLNAQKKKLQEEVDKWQRKNEVLVSSQQGMIDNMNEKATNHLNQKTQFIESINQFSEEFQRQKEKRQGLTKLASQHGLGQSNWNKQE